MFYAIMVFNIFF